jgi:hypothetical protein
VTVPNFRYMTDRDNNLVPAVLRLCAATGLVRCCDCASFKLALAGDCVIRLYAQCCACVVEGSCAEHAVSCCALHELQSAYAAR